MSKYKYLYFFYSKFHAKLLTIMRWYCIIKSSLMNSEQNCRGVEQSGSSSGS